MEMLKNSKAIHDSRLALFAEMVKKTGSHQSVLDCLMQEIESLRQQVAELTLSSDTYFAERNSARDAWRRVSKERDNHIKREMMLRNAIHDGCLCIAQYGDQPPDCLLAALADTEPKP